ncbi:MAG: hypothetical protein HRT37_25755 [Alteromonadaceae bacterium]|nr:hypothetical protein [Alteromonadaceae bacterium]
MSRYAGKPFLRLLECYVLDAIDQLDDTQRDTLVKMEPKLVDIYKINGSWLDIVNKQMEFPESLPMQIKEFWSKYLEQAKSQKVPVDPNEFAISFVNQNFSDVS